MQMSSVRRCLIGCFISERRREGENQGSTDTYVSLTPSKRTKLTKRGTSVHELGAGVTNNSCLWQLSDTTGLSLRRAGGRFQTCRCDQTRILLRGSRAVFIRVCGYRIRRFEGDIVTFLAVFAATKIHILKGQCIYIYLSI